MDRKLARKNIVTGLVAAAVAAMIFGAHVPGRRPLPELSGRDAQRTDGNGAREQIHLPGNSLLPLFTALGITLALRRA